MKGKSTSRACELGASGGGAVSNVGTARLANRFATACSNGSLLTCAAGGAGAGAGAGAGVEEGAGATAGGTAGGGADAGAGGCAGCASVFQGMAAVYGAESAC